MQISNSHDLYVFLISLLGGAVIGIIFDIFRISRRNFKLGAAVVYVQDILFWIIISFVVYATIFIANSAEIRWYEFAGIGLGFVIYYFTLSPLLLKISGFIISVVKKVVLFILKILFFPFSVIYKLFKRPVLFIVGKLKNIFSKIKLKKKRSKERKKRNFLRLKRIFKKV